jgi:hypothetical protein
MNTATSYNKKVSIIHWKVQWRSHTRTDMITTIAKNGIRKHDRAIENLSCNREVRVLTVCIRTCAAEHNDHHFCDRETPDFSGIGQGRKLSMSMSTSGSDADADNLLLPSDKFNKPEIAIQ